jgi:hypothetical protein
MRWETLALDADKQYEAVSVSSRTVIVVTTSMKEDGGEAKVTLPKAYCVSLPRDTAL